MDKRRAVWLLVLIAVFGAGLLVLWKSIGGSAPTIATTEQAQDSEPHDDRRRVAASLDAPDVAADVARERSSSVAASVATTDRSENFALEGARWIEGRVRIPAGAPSDESLAVWAVAIAEKSE